MEPGFPRKIAEDFPGVDSKVDAVFEAFGERILVLLARHTWNFLWYRKEEENGTIFNNNIS
jgi:hypothetical protein